MKKSKFFAGGVLVLALVLGLVLAGCNPEDTGNGTVNLTNQHSTDVIYWFEMKDSTDQSITIGEAVEIKQGLSKQFSVPAGTYLAGVNIGIENDMRQCIVTVAGGKTVNLVFDGALKQQ